MPELTEARQTIWRLRDLLVQDDALVSMLDFVARSAPASGVRTGEAVVLAFLNHAESKL